MRSSLILVGAVVFAPSLPAQQVRWNDRPTNTWSEEAPRVRISIDGNRGAVSGTPLRVRFEVSDNAFVTVVSVDGDGRMQILFPYSRTQRASVRGGQVYYARNPRLGGEFSFIASGRMGGYVFALASYAPLDFSRFENRDYDRIGGWSRFTVANRSTARRPDVFIDRFAAAVLWDTDTPYDYDVDYYFPTGYPSSAMNAYALCGSLMNGSAYFGIPWWQLVDFDLTPYPLRSMCRDFYNGMYCIGAASLISYHGCNIGTIVATGPVPAGPGQPADTTVVPNEGVVRGGLFAPTPVPIPTGDIDGGPPVERVAGRFDQPRGDGSDLDNVMSIPARATRKMKEDDARREKASVEGGASARSGFDRAVTGAKPEKGSTADADAVTRVQPPAREPTKATGAATSEPRTTRSKGGYGSTGRTSEPRSPDHISRPAEPKSTGASPGSTVNPPSIQGTTTTEKKKPPTN